MSNPGWEVVIGEVCAPFGFKGDVKVIPLTDHPERFEMLDEVFVGRDETHGRVFGIESVAVRNNGISMKFAGVDDLTKAELLRGMEVRIRLSDVAPLPEGEYYVDDVIGLDVVTTDGKSLGTITEIIRSPANDVYVTDQAMIPAVKEFVVSMDMDTRLMVVRPMEGLERE